MLVCPVCRLHDSKWFDGKPELKDFWVFWSALGIGALPPLDAAWVQCMLAVLSLLHPHSVGISVGSFVIWVHRRYTCRASKALRTAHPWVASPYHMLHSLMSCWKGGAGHHSIGLQHAELPAIYGTFLWTRMIQVLMPFSSFFLT